MDRWQDMGKNCKRTLVLIYCGPCSPDSDTFISIDKSKGDVQFKICKNFCQDLYHECGEAKYQGQIIEDVRKSHTFEYFDFLC